MKSLKSIVIIVPLLQAITLMGQDNILPYNPETSKTYISTNYFGPNAFPVPDMPKNTSGKRVSPFLQYEHGFRDWLFDQLKAGIKVSLNILNNQK